MISRLGAKVGLKSALVLVREGAMNHLSLESEPKKASTFSCGISAKGGGLGTALDLVGWERLVQRLISCKRGSLDSALDSVLPLFIAWFSGRGGQLFIA